MKRVTPVVACLVGGISALLLSACTQTVGHFTPTVATNPNNTVFYIYRPEAAAPSLMKPLKFDYPDVLIDGNSIGVLKYDQYLVTELAPGTHTVTITGLTTTSKGWAERDIEETISASQGGQVFMKLQVEYDTQHMTLDQLAPKYIIKLLPVSGEDAQYEIRDTTPAGN